MSRAIRFDSFAKIIIMFCMETLNLDILDMFGINILYDY